MSDEFEVTWEADDGYVGSRPHSFAIRDYELEDLETDEEIKKFFWDYVQAAFDERVDPVSEDEEGFVAWAKQVIAERKAEEEK